MAYQGRVRVNAAMADGTDGEKSDQQKRWLIRLITRNCIHPVPLDLINMDLTEVPDEIGSIIAQILNQAPDKTSLIKRDTVRENLSNLLLSNMPRQAEAAGIYSRTLIAAGLSSSVNAQMVVAITKTTTGRTSRMAQGEYWPLMCIAFMSVFLAILFIVIFEYGPSLLQWCRKSYKKLTVVMTDASSQTFETPIWPLDVEQAELDRNMNGVGRVPSAIPPAGFPVRDVVGLVPSDVVHKVPSIPPPLPDATMSSLCPGFPLIYIAPGLYRGFKYHMKPTCRSLDPETCLKVARCKICDSRTVPIIDAGATY
jgi:hypothetical protein